MFSRNLRNFLLCFQRRQRNNYLNSNIVHSFCLSEASVNFCFVLVVRLKSQEERVRSQLGQYLDRFDSVYVEMALSCRMTNGTCYILLIAYLLKREKKSGVKN